MATLDHLGELERTHSCGQLRATDAGETVVLMGWVAVRRDFGPLTFVDLRDRDGLTQIVFDAEDAPEAHARAKEVRGEYVVAVRGTVEARDESARNPKLPTGEIEVRASEVLVLNEARTPPFQLDAAPEKLAAEETRLKYRYLDLRRPYLQRNIRLRHLMVAEIRGYMNEQSFTEIETPILIKSTPEGARDYVVPSRLHHGKFYALPQSPQIFKQLCMIAGLDKYYQIARCFRDEDLRADRQPEFTQLDVEFSFATREQVYRLVEGLLARVFRLAGAELETPFPRLSYAEAMRRFGSDKPDLRFGMELQDVAFTDAAAEFQLFRETWNSGGAIRGIVVSGGAIMSRKIIDELTEFVKRYGAQGLVWIKLADETGSSILKALGKEGVEDLAQMAGAQKGDLMLIVAGKEKVVTASLGALRNEVARRQKLIPPNTFAPLWVTEFPMFEHDEDDDRYYAMHHPFTSPVDEDLEKFERAVGGGETHLFGEIRAKAYDAVVNGIEVAGGSIRIHRRDVQRLVFKALGLTEEKARERFGFFLDALEYGTPPHGGIAAGIERTLMALTGIDNIRDLMAFPKTASAADLMIDAPGPIDPHQLEELHVKIEGE
ncbi:MAG TPA: aspartate--tRNA ligase [Pyrinomonadaceae bacterium]|jgi:aspartyl-tRNA synthetase